jgi:CRISPR-associated endonuclease/helicase Cas3
MSYYAHTKENAPVEDWQYLMDHLRNAARLAAEFARAFQGQEYAYAAGLLHDIGKATKRFQAYLRHANGITDEFAPDYQGRGGDHSTPGARLCYDRSPRAAGRLLAYCISGHHGGLPDWLQDRGHGLREKLQKEQPDLNIDIPFPDFTDIPALKQWSQIPTQRGFQVQMLVRMLFSCLIDADRLDTEAFANPEQSALRRGYPTLAELQKRFDVKFAELRRNARPSAVNTIRAGVLEDCLAAAELEPGLFSLTVPTGGGKTLASFAFALRHALKFNKRRIIYVIPFTSIIEQNAKVFEDMVGEDAVLQHHSNYEFDHADWYKKLAAENWDMPMVVTTNVQFFESLFAAGTSRCRKLHNITDSVVIFDEAQAIPVEKLAPCLEAIRELSVNYGVTSVLCTATQPAIEAREEFPGGLEHVREIIKDVPALFGGLKRTSQHYLGECNIAEVAEQIGRHEQALAIVNTRPQALELYAALKERHQHVYHLSAQMYPCHRRRTLEAIRSALKNNDPCLVVSTTLIEAGVDIDIPVVFRALAGIDSIAQAAGRCNREGRRANGDVYIFKPAEGIPKGYFRSTAQCAEQLLERFEGALLEPECVREYFLDYYWLRQDRMDDKGILKACLTAIRGEIQFQKIAEFRMIDSNMCSLVVAVEKEAEALVAQLVEGRDAGFVLRKLQQYTVQLHEKAFLSLKGWLEEVYPGVYVLWNRNFYSNETGVIVEVSDDNFIY